MSKVYFKPINYHKTRGSQLSELIDKSGVFVNIKEGDYVAVKTHIGEIGNPNHISTVEVAAAVNKIKEKGGQPFITDTTTLYRHMRYDAIKHIDTALKHGFTSYAAGAPFIPADGLGFEEGVKLNSDGILSEIYMASILAQCDFLVVLSHCKGHDISSFGGAIKNIGMGCVTKKTKLEIHRLVNFDIDLKKCGGCRECVNACPEHYIQIIDNKAVNTDQQCMRCMICADYCPVKAILFSNIENMQKGLASASKAVLDSFKNKCAFINLGINISRSCDCLTAPGEMISKDIGFFASVDVVAADTAFLDKCGPGTFEKKHGINPAIQVQEAEKLGLGSSEYDLFEI